VTTAHVEAGELCTAKAHGSCSHPAGATLHLGGEAWAHPALLPHLVPLADVTPYPGNPRRHDQDGITSSVRDLGLYTGVNVQQSTGHVIVGNGRRAALTELGAALVPAIRVDVDDQRAAAIVARDNRTSDLSTNDPTDLLALLQSFEDDTELLELAGYDDEAAMAVLMRQAEAVDVFVHGPGEMLDEWKAASGEEETDYRTEYARKVTVYLRDEEAVQDFQKKLGLPEDFDARVHLPLGWQPYDRRRTWQAEQRGDSE
jgi:ParB-like chromosome segregation protein Spo0J